MNSMNNMPRMNRSRRLLPLLLPVALLTACTEYTIETTVNPDGSGLRVERMEAQENEDENMAPDVKVSRETFQVLMHTSPAEGWGHTETADADGDPIHVFQRRTPVERLPGWSKLNGKVHITGAAGAAADQTRGYVRLGDVRFHNQLHLQMAADSEGSTSFTYREVFRWDQAMDALVEFLMAELDGALAGRYPNLPAGERGQIVGFARARFWVAVEEGLLTEDADDDHLISEVARTTAEQGIHVVRMHSPEAGQEGLEGTLNEALVESDDDLVRFLEEDLPGLNLAINSEITFRLKLPGRVTRSNAHSRENGMLIWKFSPGDALHGPIEIVAESEVGG